MHLPDGYLNATCCVATTTLAAGAVGFAAVKLSRQAERRPLAALATVGAGIFAAQMLNFPIAAGTSGHLLGGALAGALLGPWAGILAMTLVLAVQCLVFGDGGLAVLGANVLNMGVVGALMGHGAVVAAEGRQFGLRGRVVAGCAAAWLSVMFAALLCSLELAFSGTGALEQVLPAMAGVHALIGAVEAAVSGVVLLVVYAGSMQPLLAARLVTAPRTGLLTAIGASLFAPLAASSPDGLEHVAEVLGFAGRSQAPLASLLTDYSLPGIANPTLAVALAGLVGVCVVFVVGTVTERLAVRRAG